MTSATSAQPPKDVEEAQDSDDQTAEGPAGDGDGPVQLALIEQGATFADADAEGVCAGVCYTWARYARAGRLAEFVEAFESKDPVGEVFTQITATSEQINQRLRALRSKMQAVIDGNKAILAELRELRSKGADLQAQAQLPPAEQSPGLPAEIESVNRRVTELSTQARTSVAESTNRINEQIRLATLDPSGVDPIALNDGPLTVAAAITAEVRSLLETSAPGFIFLQLYGQTGGSSHLIGVEITEQTECKFLDPNTALFQVVNVDQLADLFDYSWDKLYAEDYNRYRVRVVK